MSRFTEARLLPRERAGGRVAVLILALMPLCSWAQSKFPNVGRPATPAEIKAWDIDVRPDFKGLPPGSGSVEKGQQVWETKCASCHGVFGESNEVFAPLIGGTTAADIKAGRVKALTSPDTGRTMIMKLSTLSTLWDYVNRAMPWTAPKTLSTEEVYAVVAYMLNLADVVPGDFVLSDRNIAEVQRRLPNRDGMTREHGLWDVRGKPDVASVACMKDCPVEAKLASSLPEHAQNLHGNLAEQNRVVGPTRGAGKVTAAANAAPAKADLTALARQKACLSCHATDKRVVGPAFREVAQRYKGRPEAAAMLVERVKKGGAGNWGTVPMPPNPDLAEADARALVLWILESQV